jgi:tRNA pseudouridine55 synthase
MKKNPPEITVMKQPEGILLLNKPTGCTSFDLIRKLRKAIHIKKIGHAGTLDPLAEGLMILLIGRNYTKKANEFITLDKTYEATIELGKSTTTFDSEGETTFESEKIPSEEEIQQVLKQFQGKCLQKPPMFSAKKFQGKKLYEYARKGQNIERESKQISLETTFISYNYPYLQLSINCSSGTYIRSIADDIGTLLGCGAHLCKLVRTRIGSFTLEESLSSDKISTDADITSHLRPLV